MVLTVVLATASFGQPPTKPADAPRDGGVHKMEIIVGPTRTVHYFAPGLSPGEQSSLRALERAENDVALADNLQAVRRQYVTSEVVLEPYRRSAQQGLFSASTVNSYTSYVGWFAPRRFAYPYAVPYAYPYGYSGFGNDYFAGYAGLGAPSLAAPSMGDEGVFKNEMVKAMASQMTPEYAAAADRRYNDALVKAASSSEAVAKGLGLRKPEATPVVFEPNVTVTLKAGGPVKGKLISDDGEWLTVDTGKTYVTIRISEVVTTEREKPPK
jgi:hypothetical protein